MLHVRLCSKGSLKVPIMPSTSKAYFLFIFISVKPAQAMLVQNFSMPEVCEGFRGWEECPDFLDEQQWQFYTATCCGGHSALIFHCQEQYIKHKRHVVTGCLQTTTCDSGEFAHLREEMTSDLMSSVVSLECLQCADDNYSPMPLQSYMYRYDHCPLRRQICSREYGKTDVTQGDASHDTRCRCLQEEGWVPDPKTTGCTTSSGFDSDEGCFCVKDE